MTTTNECYVYFRLDGPALDPSLVSVVLSLEPTESRRVGEVLRKRNGEPAGTGKPSEEGRWALYDRIPRDARVDFEERVKDVLEQLRPCFAAAARLCRIHHGALVLVGYFNEYDPGLWFGADTVQRVAALGAGIECDFYHLMEPEADEN